MAHDVIDEKSILVHHFMWCPVVFIRVPNICYPIQCWQITIMTPYIITRGWWVIFEVTMNISIKHIIDVNPSDAGSRIFWDNKAYTLAADALAPCVTRSSVAIVLNIQDKDISHNSQGMLNSTTHTISVLRDDKKCKNISWTNSAWVMTRVKKFLLCDWVHFTNNLSIPIQMWWKFCFVLIQNLMNQSVQIFAHDTTAVLLWHVQKLVMIPWPVVELH